MSDEAKMQEQENKEEVLNAPSGAEQSQVQGQEPAEDVSQEEIMDVQAVKVEILSKGKLLKLKITKF